MSSRLECKQLRSFQFEHEVRWKLLSIAPDRLIENFRFYTVEVGEVRIEDDSLAPYHPNGDFVRLAPVPLGEH